MTARGSGGLRLGAVGAVGMVVIGGLAGCGGGPELDKTKPLADGEFSATSAPDEEGAIGEVRITVADGRVAEAEFEVYETSGRPKDADYGKDSAGEIANPEYYRKAQAAVEAFGVYARELIEVGYPQDVDVISGATWAHEQFVEAAVEALTESQEIAAGEGGVEEAGVEEGSGP